MIGVVVVAATGTVFTLREDGNIETNITSGDNSTVIEGTKGNVNIHVEPDNPWPKN